VLWASIAFSALALVFALINITTTLVHPLPPIGPGP
jgi:hypothetical protein